MPVSAPPSNLRTVSVAHAQSSCAGRSLKQFDVTAGAPSFVEIQAFHRDETSIRTFAYSGDGAYLASSSPAGSVLLSCRDDLRALTWSFFRRSVIVISAESAECVLSLPLKTIIETRLSPRGTFLQTWERPGAHRHPGLCALQDADSLCSQARGGCAAAQEPQGVPSEQRRGGCLFHAKGAGRMVRRRVARERTRL